MEIFQHIWKSLIRIIFIKIFSIHNSHVFIPLYSPELVKNEEYGEKVDVWAMGCLIYLLCSLQPPFNSSNMLALVEKVGVFEGFWGFLSLLGSFGGCIRFWS